MISGLSLRCPNTCVSLAMIINLVSVSLTLYTGSVIMSCLSFLLKKKKKKLKLYLMSAISWPGNVSREIHKYLTSHKTSVPFFASYKSLPENKLCVIHIQLCWCHVFRYSEVAWSLGWRSINQVKQAKDQVHQCSIILTKISDTP